MPYAPGRVTQVSLPPIVADLFVLVGVAAKGAGRQGPSRMQSPHLVPPAKLNRYVNISRLRAALTR